MAKKKSVKKKPVKKKIAKKKATNTSAAPKRASTIKKAVKKKLAGKTADPFSMHTILDAVADAKLSTKQQQFLDAIESNASKIEKCIDAGAKVNTRIAGYTPLAHAVVSSTKESVIKTLIKHGAKVNADPVLLLTTESSLTKILLKAGADPNVSRDGLTPLLNAVDFRSEQKTVDLLIKAGAQVTDKVKSAAKRWDDPLVMKMLGLREAPNPQKLFIQPLLPKPAKIGYQKVFDITGFPPLGLDGLTVYACQIEPDRFLSAKEALSSTGLSRATEIVAKQLYGTIDGCEFVRSDIRNGCCLLMIPSRSKFHYLKKPKKLFDQLKKLDAAHPMNFYSLHSGRFSYHFKKKLSTKNTEHWRGVLKGLGIDGVTIRVSEEKVSINFET